MDEGYLLSIAIPTRNRAKELSECLQSFVTEIGKLNENIEIVVSDNASNDNTQSVLQGFSSAYNFIKYVVMEKNVVFDLNLLSAIEHSSGKYIWTFSDDDIIMYGALATICEIITKHEPNYIITKYNQFSVINGNKVFARQDLVIRKNEKRITKDSNDNNFTTILTKVMTTMGYLPVNIFKSDKINLEQVKQNINKVRSWSHIYMMAQATINGGGYISSYICVSQRTGNSKAGISVFLKALPETFSFIFDQFDIDSQFRTWFFHNLKKESVSLRGLVYITTGLKIDNQIIDINNDIDYRISSELISFYFKFIFPLIPKILVVFGDKIVRSIKGKGFGLDGELEEIRFS